MITTRLECSICNTNPQETEYESLSHAIGELLEEGVDYRYIPMLQRCNPDRLRGR